MYLQRRRQYLEKPTRLHKTAHLTVPQTNYYIQHHRSYSQASDNNHKSTQHQHDKISQDLNLSLNNFITEFKSTNTPLISLLNT